MHGKEKNEFLNQAFHLNNPYLNVISNYGDIFEIQGSINLIHDIEGCGFVVMESKDQGQGAEGLLSP